MKHRVEFYRLSLKDRVKRQIDKFKRYCYTSFISASLMFLLLFIFTSTLHIYYLISFVMAFVVSLTLSFVLNKLYTFNSFNPTKITKQYSYFFIVSIVAFIGNFLALYVLVGIVGLWYLLAQLIIGLVGLPILFLSHKRYVFAHPRG